VISLVTFLVPEYDEGLRFFVDGLGWSCLADEDQGRKRWVTVAPPGGGTGLVLARSTSDMQRAALGRQTGDRVGFFLDTSDFDSDAARIVASGGRFLEEPRNEAYGRVAQWCDPWGNRWDLIQRAGTP
jgi:predicted enzyme related to lactoylglutathione lyase